jgi:hypothetical protein
VGRPVRKIAQRLTTQERILLLLETGFVGTVSHWCKALQNRPERTVLEALRSLDGTHTKRLNDHHRTTPTGRPVVSQVWGPVGMPMDAAMTATQSDAVKVGGSCG